ncbi:MAG: rRNA processing protein RimM [Actinomycetia bacterium]|nr:rRNA processing protein RimM [Actinomycetes bacterium]
MDRLEVGRIGKAHGLKGEVVVTPITNHDERFAVGAVLYVDDGAFTIVSSRPQQHRFVVRFEGVDDRDGAEALRGRFVHADPLEATADDELWVHELIGATVVGTTGEPFGTVVSVEANPAHDQLVLDSGALIPMVFVVEHVRAVTEGADARAARIIVDPPAGLFEAQARTAPKVGRGEGPGPDGAQ